jgi:hypothetical protein
MNPLFTVRLDDTGLDRMHLERDVGDAEGHVRGAWSGRESVRDIYLTNDAAEVELL